jgi:hypothetical protein
MGGWGYRGGESERNEPAIERWGGLCSFIQGGRAHGELGLCGHGRGR